MHKRISTEIQGTVAGIEIRSEWIYTDAEQYAVTVVLAQEEDYAVAWTFGRDLIQDAKDNQFAGQGDVRISINAGKFYLGLTSHEGAAEVVFPWAMVDRFLWQTYDLCPRGSEQFDVDSFISTVLTNGESS